MKKTNFLNGFEIFFIHIWRIFSKIVEEKSKQVTLHQQFARYSACQNSIFFQIKKLVVICFRVITATNSKILFREKYVYK